MAQRRMFSLNVVDTDAFLDMPSESRLLYYDLSMRADDDGFVSNPKKIMRMTGAADDAIKVLEAKKFIIPFDSGVCVIKHWKIHNYIQSDRYHETQYIEEKASLREENGMYTKCIQNVSKVLPEVRLELGKVKNTVCAKKNKHGEPLEMVMGADYAPDYWSPKQVVEMKRRLARALGEKKSTRWSQLTFGVAWDFRKAFRHFQGYDYAGPVIIDEWVRFAVTMYEAGETRETIREMLVAFFQSDKAKKITITPTSALSSHTYNSWKQGKLIAKKTRNFWE